MLSIKDNDKYEEIIKYSKFISFIFRVYSKNEVNDYIDKIKKEYPNATHYCYGYVIDNDIKSSDDGEPSRTAGAPILNQITGNNLNYTLIIVVRYFGGVKLGVGPLTRAYGKVAREVIRDNNIITLVKGYDIMITFGYSDIKDIDYILREAISQQDAGAHILDVNVGLPDIDEPALMREVVQELQSVTSLPLQIDTVDISALEAAMRIYNGKPMVNSVNGKQSSMDAVFPLIKKYGGVVVGLTLDEDGIPATAEGRVKVAGKIIEEAKKYGIDKKDIVIDALAMTISSEPEGAKVTLETLRRLRDEVGVCTVLGVSNISFGLPSRPIVNSIFYTMAMQNGLSVGIINPNSEDMMKAWYAYHALMNLDSNCENYINKYAQQPGTAPVSATGSAHKMTLKSAIERGLREEANSITSEMIQEKDGLEIINEELIPALNTVGEGFEKGTVFLPQLLMSAEAAKTAFAVLKEKMDSSGEVQEKKGKIILATVKGDIHDIGKNIVKVLLENYSFDVIDLGKDVPPETIVDTVLEQDIHLVGLSALMTTTVVSMEETIRQLREKAPHCLVMVGGAVLNQDYADMIGADFYGKDAMQSVHYAQRVFGTEE